MNKLLKLADLFEKSINQDIFGDISWPEESQKLHHLAGKLIYKSNNADDKKSAKKLREAGELLLKASDILKEI